MFAFLRHYNSNLLKTADYGKLYIYCIGNVDLLASLRSVLEMSKAF